MTRVRILREGKRILGLEITGHTADAKSRRAEIICAAVSAIAQTCAIGITEVLRIRADVRVVDEPALLGLMMPEGEDGAEAQAILATAVAGLRQIEKQYPDYITITFLKRRAHHHVDESATFRP